MPSLHSVLRPAAISLIIIMPNAHAGIDDTRVQADELNLEAQWGEYDDSRRYDFSVDYGMTDGVQLSLEYSPGKDRSANPPEEFSGVSVGIEYWPFPSDNGPETGLKFSVGQDRFRSNDGSTTRSDWRSAGIAVGWGGNGRSLELEATYFYENDDSESSSEWRGSVTFGIGLSENTELSLELGDSEDDEPFTDLSLDYDVTDNLTLTIFTGWQDGTNSAGLGISYSF